MCVLLWAARRALQPGTCGLLGTRAAMKLKVDGRLLVTALSTPIEQLSFASQQSRHEAPTDGASVRLLHGARWRQTQGECSSLPLSTPRRHLSFACQ